MDKPDTKKWLNKLKLSEFPEPVSVRLRYPVLLCHGYGAIASLVKPSPLYDVAMLMRSHNVPAWAPNIVPYATTETRAEEWIRIIEKLTASADAEKINIVAHSMGGLDMRYALSQYDIGDKVESFTSVCTPHRGTSLAELALKTPEAIRDKLGDFLDWMGNNMFPRIESDSVGSIEQLTRRYAEEVFNPSVSDLTGLPCYSYTSAVGRGTDQPIKVITRYQNHYIFDREGINDGFVSVESGKWGEHIATGNISHLEQINLNIKNDRKKLFEKFWLDVIRMLESKGH